MRHNIPGPIAEQILTAYKALFAQACETMTADDIKLHQESYAAIQKERAEYEAQREKYIVYLGLAKEMVVDGEIEVDDGAVLSISEEDGVEGAYVEAWVWVSTGEEAIYQE